jgi:hypothetical protein
MGAVMVNEQHERGPVLPFDQDIDVVFMRHELFTFYGGEEKTLPEELVAVFEYPAKLVYEYEFESREGDRGLATRHAVHYELLATKRECQVLLAELCTKGRYYDELVKALHAWPEE